MPPMRLLAAAFAVVFSISSVRANQFPPNFEDAPLHAVTFVDKTEGWAVGEHGVIWHTVDSGKFWERQKSGTRASLRAVQFLTPYTGYAVGRTELPATLGHSSGIVLMTTDGGLHWSELTNGLMPGLMAVKFFSDKNGIVAGDSTLAFPCGIFTTTDGGQSWKPHDGPKGINWTAMDFRDESSGVLAGSGQLCLMKNGKTDGSFTSSSKQNSQPYLMSLSRGGNGDHFAISNEGTVIHFDSTAKVVATNINTGSSKYFASNGCHPNAIAVTGKHLWVVGCPGSAVIHSHDEGKIWTNQESNSPCSLNAIHMLDETTGWAVGDLGTILNTIDGGKSWSVQRTGGQRCGVMFVNANGADVPFDTLAMLGAKDGHLCCVVQVSKGIDQARLTTVIRTCGGAVTDCLNCEPTDKELIQKLVLRIRQWRPETVVIGREQDAVRIAVLEAVKLAADDKAFPEQIASLKLSPHAVKSVFADHPTTKGATVQFDYAKLVPELADDVRDFCEIAPMLLGSNAKIPAYRFYASVYSSTINAVPAELVSEALLPRNGTGRRKAVPPNWPTEYVAAKEKIAVARRKIDQIVAQPEKFGNGEKAVEQILNLLVGLPEDIASRAAGNAAKEFARAGQWGLAHELYGFVVESFEPYPEAAEAARWVLTFHTSSQVRRRIELGHVNPLPKSVFDTVDDDAGVKSASHTDTEPGFVKTVYRFKTGETARKWNRFALDLDPKLIAFGPGVVRDPAVIRARQLARERVGITVASQEPVAPEQSIVAMRFSSKPKLDGFFDEEGWKTAKPATMAVGDCKTETKFGFDDRFLYVAIHASHPVGKRVPKVETRERDADLTGHDRVEFAFDLDHGSGESAFRFAVDHRGCLAESCWGDRNWNPKWFVAFDSQDTGWTAEIAIPLAELTGASVANSNWGLELKRICPGVGENSFTPASGKTVLRFEK